jgi:hypothetical protein
MGGKQGRRGYMLLFFTADGEIEDIRAATFPAWLPCALFSVLTSESRLDLHPASLIYCRLSFLSFLGTFTSGDKIKWGGTS